MKKIYNKTKKLVPYAAVLFFASLPKVVSAGWDVSTLYGFGLSHNSIAGIITKFLLWTLGLLGFLGVIGFSISGIMYLTSYGDDKRMETAKQAMLYSIIGIVVGLSGLIVIGTINSILNLTIETGNGGI